MIVVALALAISFAEPPPSPLLEYGTEAMRLLRIEVDGAWVAPANNQGKLTPDELTRLTAAVAGAELVSRLGPPCPGTPGYLFVRTQRGEVRWSNGCGLRPHASVLALVELAESLTTRRPDPTLVRLRRERTGQPDSVETAVVMRTGAWTTHRGRGVLEPGALAAIIEALDAALIEAPPIPDAAVCKGDFPHELEVPGRGTLRFLWPCAKPSPSLQVALDKLYLAVGLRAP